MAALGLGGVHVNSQFAPFTHALGAVRVFLRQRNVSLFQANTRLHVKRAGHAQPVCVHQVHREALR